MTDIYSCILLEVILPTAVLFKPVVFLSSKFTNCSVLDAGCISYHCILTECLEPYCSVFIFKIKSLLLCF